MANYDALKRTIDANITDNGVGAITGPVLNEVLNEMVDVLGDGGGANLTGYVSVASIADLPAVGQPTLGYLVGQNLYLYVGEGGDTAGGKYKNCGHFKGPKGDNGDDGESAYEIWIEEGHSGNKEDFLASLQGNSGYTGAAGELEIVNNLTDGGAAKALSAEMGKSLNGKIIPKMDIDEHGIYLADENRYAAMKYDEDGFDVAKLSAHLIQLLKSSGIGSANVVEVEEQGFFVVDMMSNIGFAVESTGIRPSALKYDYIN